MKELTLEELKEIEFEILKVFDAFCKENNIRYFLAFGTLLGAIRYKKFIPWDDDVDVLVPREDYERLVKIFNDNEKYHLFAFEKNKNFHYPFAKLCDMTTKKEQIVYKNKGVKLGVDIDIFPLDYFGNNLDEAKREVESIRKNMRWLKVTKLEKPLATNKAKYLIWSIILVVLKAIGGGFFIKKIIKESVNPHQKGSAYMGAKVWCIWGERGIIPSEVFESSVDVDFEGLKLLHPRVMINI